MSENGKLIATVIGIVVLLGTEGGAYYWMQGQTSDLETENSRLTNEIRAAEAKIAAVPAARKKLADLKDQVETFNRILPNERELANIVEVFERARIAAGIRALGFEPVEETGKKNPFAQATGKYEKHTFRITTNATYFQFIRFINLLEEYRRPFMQVESFTISRNRDSECPKAKITLVLSTFSYPAGKSQPKPEVARR
jgi:Tfp pilus assembly protein PilO